jgi:hypothetical protein
MAGQRARPSAPAEQSPEDPVIEFALTAVAVVGLLSSAVVTENFRMGEPPEPAAASSAAIDIEGDSDPDKVICRSVRPPTGTRVQSGRSRQKLCMTRADWEEQERAAQEALKVRDSGLCAPGECRE